MFDASAAKVLFQFKSAGIQLIIGAFLRDQVVMVTTLNDMTMIENHDGVRVLHGGKPVCDNKDGSALHERWTRSSVLVSMELVASSRIMTGGSATAARAMERS